MNGSKGEKNSIIGARSWDGAERRSKGKWNKCYPDADEHKNYGVQDGRKAATTQIKKTMEGE